MTRADRTAPGADHGGGSAAHIRVVCKAASHRRSRPTIVATFEHDDDGWTRRMPRVRRRPGVPDLADGDAPEVLVYLVGDRVTEEPWTEADSGAVRERYRLECASCGLTATARPQTLARALDGYAAVGRDELDLGALARTL